MSNSSTRALRAPRPSISPRGTETWRLYATHALGSFVVNGLGAVLLPLQSDLGISYAAAALYPTIYSISTVTVGLVGGPIARRLGGTRMLVWGFALILAGAALFWVPSRPVTMLGALVLGLGGAFTLQVVPGRMSQLHGAQTDIALSEANSAASFSAIVPALLVGAALGMGLTWRLGYLVPVFGITIFIIWATLTHRPEVDRPDPEPLLAMHGTGAAVAPFVGGILTVAAEFTIVFWAATATASRFEVPTSVAVVTTSVFIGGVALGRVFGTGVIRRMSRHGVLFAAISVAFVGFAVFFLAPNYPVAVLGLFVTGLGLSVMFPVFGTMILAACTGDSERGSQLTVLAVGIAVGLSPLTLGVLAQWAEVHLAMLIVPLYLIMLAALTTLTRGREGTVAPE